MDADGKGNLGNERNEIFKICDQAEWKTRRTDKGQSE